MNHHPDITIHNRHDWLEKKGTILNNNDNTLVVYEPSNLSIEPAAATASLETPFIWMYRPGTSCRWSTSIRIYQGKIGKRKRTSVASSKLINHK
jgi:hypothetical protein